MIPTTWSNAITAASDPSTPVQLLEALEHIPALQPHLARNPNTRPQHLLTLAPHYPDQVRHNPSLALAYLTHGTGRERELAQILTPAKRTKNPYHPYTLNWPADHPTYANPHLLRGALVDELIHRHQHTPDALTHLARNPRLERSTLTKLLRHPTPETRYHAARNPNLSTRTLLEEAREGDERGLPHQGVLYTALAERGDPAAQRWLHSVLPHDSSLRAFLRTPPRHTPTPQHRNNHHILRHLRNQLFTDPEHATEHLTVLATDPNTHPATRARAALSCDSACDAARSSDLFSRLAPGPRAQQLARAQRDTLAIALTQLALDARTQHNDDAVFIPF